MHISDFDYELPEELIAQEPLATRDASRMLVLDRHKRNWSDSSFTNFAELLRPNDVVVLNNSRVFPARLAGSREGTGGKVEIFLVREIEPLTWEALIRPGGRLRRGDRVDIGKGKLTVELIDDPGQELRQVQFHTNESL